MTISVVIISYRVKGLLEQCLLSLLEFHRHHSLQIILVDNDSRDGTTEMVQSKFPSVILIPLNQNIGFPAANNLAFEKATGDFIWMLNPDTSFTGDVLSPMLALHQNKSEKIITAPLLINSDGSQQISVWHYPSIGSVVCQDLYLKAFLGNFYYLNSSFENPVKVEAASGASLVFRRDLIYEIGTLDESLFWIEDVDFCFRANKSGVETWLVPDAQMFHHSGSSARKNYRISLSNQVFNKLKFFRKHYSILSLVVLTVWEFFNCLFRALIFGLAAAGSSTSRKKSAAYFYTLTRIFNPPKGIE